MIAKDDESKKNTKVFVSDEIGESYKDWDYSDIILITAGTGQGKSYFCMHVLAERAIEENQKILYLVNRKILKKQLEDERDKIDNERVNRFYYMSHSLKNHICFMTYQYLEAKLKRLNPQETQIEMVKMRDEYKFVVYDECHYFYSDSNFNTSTELSYDFLRCCFNNNIQIFMSATMENMLESIKNRIPVLRNEEYASPRARFNIMVYPEKRYIHYSCPSDYSYIKLSVFQDYKDLVKLISDKIKISKEKWLVFVDSKEYGKSLMKDLIKTPDANINTDDIIYIDANYDQDVEAQASVLQLIKQNLIKKSVVITTPVMDNGISFHDIELRNIVLLTDTREEFIQMIGRKRKDGNSVRIYICKQSQQYFQTRFRYVDKKLCVYNKEMKMMNNCFYNCYVNGPVSTYINDFVVASNYQQNILDRIIQNEPIYQGIVSFTYVYQGIVANNLFSIKRLSNLKAFYEEIITELETDDMAFVKRQAQWLGLSLDDVETIVAETKEEITERFRKSISEVLSSYDNKMLSKEENIELKKKVVPDLKFFLKDTELFEEKDGSNLAKTDRPFSAKQFNSCMEKIGLSYIMNKKEDNYIITTTDQKEEK